MTSDLVLNYGRSASDPPSTTGIWRGEVTSISGDDYEFVIPRLTGVNASYKATTSVPVANDLAVGDNILLSFSEGRNDEIAVLGKIGMELGSVEGFITGVTAGTNLNGGGSAATVTLNLDGTISLDGLTVDTDTLHVDATNSRVGIGTTSPEKPLHIYSATLDHPLVIESGDVRAGLEMKDSTTVTAPLIRASGDDLLLRTGGSDNLVVNSSGNVGIGTLSPVAGLHIEGFGDVSNSSTGHYLQMGATSGENIRIDNNEINAVNNGSAATLYLQNDGGTLKVGNNSTTNMTVSGVLTPGQIDAFDNTNAPTSSTAKFLFGRSGSQAIAFHGGSGGNYITSISQTTNQKSLRIRVSKDDNATGYEYFFDTVGLHIGSGSAPSYPLQVQGDAYVTGKLRFNNTALIASEANSSNVDHIWHDEAANAWNFCSDTSYQAAGNSTIVAGSFSGSGANLTSLNASNISSGTFPDRFSNTTRYNIGYIDGVGASTRDKLRVWNSGDYTIGMQSGVTFGALNDYAMTFQMNNDSDRGFWWGDAAHGVNQGAMSLTTNGKLYVANNIKVGYGETNTSDTFSYDLEVNGTSLFTDRMIVKADGHNILTLQDTGSTDTGGYLRFANSSGTSMGFVGYANNDDLYMKNDNSGGNLYFGVQAGYAFQVDTSRNLVPYQDNTQSLGKYQRAWNHFYLHQGNTFTSGGYWTLRSRDSDRQVMEYTSSERFKKDIVDLPTEEAYQILDARPIKFRGIDDDDDTPLEAGLSAESLHEAGFEYAVRYDEGHWGETPRSVYYEMLTAPLIKICKDLHDRVTALEAG